VFEWKLQSMHWHDDRKARLVGRPCADIGSRAYRLSARLGGCRPL